MQAPRQQKYVVASLVGHAAVLFALIAGFDFTAPLPVIENTNQHDVISAVILGETPKSKILPQQPIAQPVMPIAKKEPEPTPPPKPQTTPKPKIAPPDPEAIALKINEKKKIAEKIRQAEQKRRDKLAQDLLADIQKVNDQQKKRKQKQLQAKFEKTLREQAEKSLRQQLLNEEITLQGTQSRQSQGEVNKYKALILQVISEHWVVPLQANKKLSSELMIRLAPGGMVVDVQITKSSGDPALDRSARAAVLKASPLPVPPDPSAFEAFRQFVLKVKPENIANITDVL